LLSGERHAVNDKKPSVQKKRRENLKGPFFLLLPAFIIILGITVYPVFYSLFLSITNHESSFAGLNNYIAVFSDPAFVQSWGRTLLFAAIAIIFETAFGLVLAMLLNQKFVRFKTFMQTSFIIPMMIAPIAVGVTFKIMYHPLIGVINYFLSAFSIKPTDWLGNNLSAFAAILIMEIWRGTPFMFLLTYSGLQGIPQDMYEAADLDGARPARVFMDITMKWLKPTLLLAIALRMLDMFNAFDEIMGVTAGGPGNATELIAIYIYKTSFRFQEFNTGAAMSVIFLLLTVILAIQILKRSFRTEGK
jgi:multiple sugar transport system permease protein